MPSASLWILRDGVTVRVAGTIGKTCFNSYSRMGDAQLGSGLNHIFVNGGTTGPFLSECFARLADARAGKGMFFDMTRGRHESPAPTILVKAAFWRPMAAGYAAARLRSTY